MARKPGVFDIVNITKGTDVFIRFEFFTIDADGVETPIDFTGHEFQFNAKRQLSDSDANRVLAIVGSTDTELDISDIANGVVDFVPTAAQTAAWVFNNAFYNLISISAGSPGKKMPLLEGRLPVKRNA